MTRNAVIYLPVGLLLFGMIAFLISVLDANKVDDPIVLRDEVRARLKRNESEYAKLLELIGQERKASGNCFAILNWPGKSDVEFQNCVAGSFDYKVGSIDYDKKLVYGAALKETMQALHLRAIYSIDSNSIEFGFIPNISKMCEVRLVHSSGKTKPEEFTPIPLTKDIAKACRWKLRIDDNWYVKSGDY